LNKTENEEISGERLFLRYAYPCVEVRERRKLIKPNDVMVLNVLVDGGEEPDHYLLWRCFPDAARLFGEFMGENTLLDDPWPIEIVKEFWRLHIGREPKCAVMHGKVETANMLGNMVKIKIEGLDKIVVAANRYKLPISKDDRVFFHRHIIAEVERAD
jgi:hypothetical protein